MSEEQITSKRPVLKKVLKVIGTIIYYLFIAFMVLLVFFLLMSKVTKRTPSIGKYQMYIVLSGSMKPQFDTGSLVIEKSINPENIKKGDIVTYKALNGTTITHRVVGINNDEGLTFTTKGDANNTSDPSPVDAKNIVGKVTFAVPYIGYVMNFIKTIWGTVTIIIVPGVLIIIYEFMNIFGAMKEEIIKKHDEEVKSEIEKNN